MAPNQKSSVAKSFKYIWGKILGKKFNFHKNLIVPYCSLTVIHPTFASKDTTFIIYMVSKKPDLVIFLTMKCFRIEEKSTGAQFCETSLKTGAWILLFWL
jgi:hypothetical protein